MISIFPLSTSLTYLAICHQHLFMQFMSFTLFFMQEHALHTSNLSNETSYYQTRFGTRISRTLIKISCTEVLCSIKWPLSGTMFDYDTCWRTFFILLWLLYIHRADYSFFRFHGHDNERTAVATGQQGVLVLTPPRYRIPPLSF